MHDRDVSAFAELRAKYEEMRALRTTDDGSYDPRERMAALAARFPGALREIDELPLDEIERRIDALTRAERDPTAAAQWMHAMTRFHALARGALFAKRRVETDDGSAWPEEALAWKHEARIACPPQGRLMNLVYERLGEELAITPDAAKALTFRSKQIP
jgi:hypothetical protein